MRSPLTLALGLVGFCVSPAVQAVVVSIDEPTFLEPAVGEVVVVASVETRDPIRSVELFVDDKPYPILTAPPFRWIAEVGEESTEHVFRVVATLASGPI